jgi:hypothetical protein
MEGFYFKGAEDEDGNKIPEGRLRPDPWVVIEPVARAVAVLERLHPNALLFPSRIEPHLTGLKIKKRRRLDSVRPCTHPNAPGLCRLLRIRLPRRVRL